MNIFFNNTHIPDVGKAKRYQFMLHVTPKLFIQISKKHPTA